MASLVEHDVYLQYKIELAVNGMVDLSNAGLDEHTGDPTHLPVVARLQKLREYATRFRSGKFKDSYWEYSWERGTVDTNGWEVQLAFGSAISYVVIKPPQQEISVCAPPLLDGGMRRWTIPLTAFPADVVTAVSLDLSQDLLIVAQLVPNSLGVKAHVRSFSEPAVPHADAARPIFSTEPLVLRVLEPGVERTRITYVQIHRHVVAWMLTVDGHDSSDVEVWDWKTGYLIWRCHFDLGVTFTLLDQSFLAIVPNASDTLLVYRYDLPEADPITTRSRQTLELRLPGRPRAETAITRIQETSIPVRPSSTVPFWPDPDLRIFVVVLGDCSALLIPYSTFRTLLYHPESAHTSPRGRAKPIPWKNWGPHATLLLHLPYAERVNFWTYWKMRYCYSYGSRVAISCYSDYGTSHTGEVFVFDLNPWAAREARRYPPTMSPDSRYLDTPTTAKAAFGTERAAIPHAILHEGGLSRSFGQAPPVLAMDHRGYTTVYTQGLVSSRYLGSISFYV
ncbi:hypothetical protein L226DRAFT_613173 [Lentinus tigrinus ALCF2SS1-7]|uniref:uncharacterized protein n=1 Tax=Lentinus tigrinus ALCF2SS1-7 TaxID=1328758 RepID=UPI001165F553|nr:hypothetical protein L226DRAFT_613173 [Lentinus tigrinus ALCF2SS1-7]